MKENKNGTPPFIEFMSCFSENSICQITDQLSKLNRTHIAQFKKKNVFQAKRIKQIFLKKFFVYVETVLLYNNDCFFCADPYGRYDHDITESDNLVIFFGFHQSL